MIGFFLAFTTGLNIGILLIYAGCFISSYAGNMLAFIHRRKLEQ